jgi:hypothetical protein
MEQKHTQVRSPMFGPETPAHKQEKTTTKRVLASNTQYFSFTDVHQETRI